MLLTMESLDELWEEMIASATANPREIKRESLTDFIAVKTANDAIREAAVSQLIAAFETAVRSANDKGAGIGIEKLSPHRFQIERMNLAGSVIKLRLGVRCLTVEAGWTRTPSDGFMRGNALAVARFTHFGFARENAQLHLLKFESEPRWFFVENDGLRRSFEISDLVAHLRILVDNG